MIGHDCPRSRAWRLLNVEAFRSALKFHTDSRVKGSRTFCPHGRLSSPRIPLQKKSQAGKQPYMDFYFNNTWVPEAGPR